MNERRLIEDYIPIEAISAESSREKSLRHGHISTLHLWWARRPLVACRAAVYASLVSADFHAPKNGDPSKRKSLARANAAKFLTRLCKYPGDPKVIEEARQHIRECHKAHTGSDEPPKVLDCFAGGGSIPLEALRLGCEAYALDLNPVAHLIELCTLVYPQKYGKPDSNTVGCDNGKWAGLAKEVEYWGKWVLENVKREVGDLYPPIPDYTKGKIRQVIGDNQLEMAGKGFDTRGQQKLAIETPIGYLTPAAYLWTRTVPCKNPGCGAVVPLVRQTWLCKKKGRYIALRVTPDASSRRASFTVVQSSHSTEKDAINQFGFDPANFSKRGAAVCVLCGTPADTNYVKQQAQAGKMGRQLMAIVCTRSDAKGKVYLGADTIDSSLLPDDGAIQQRLAKLCEETGLTLPDEPLVDKAADQLPLYGMTNYGQLFTPRQLLTLMTFVKWVRGTWKEMLKRKYNIDYSKSIMAYLGIVNDRMFSYNATANPWHVTGEKATSCFGRQALPMVWDYGETNPISKSFSWTVQLEWVVEFLNQFNSNMKESTVIRSSATELPLGDNIFDAVITDPPYYDNISYASLSDFFYVILKRTIGFLFPEHFTSNLTPKKNETIADPYRHTSQQRAKQFYEDMMLKAFKEIYRVLRPDGILTLVYAHKTVAGWSTLINSLKKAKFFVNEAWPLDTEMKARLLARDSAALASSIFLVASKRSEEMKNAYYEYVRKELESIVRERVDTLWKEGINGADLIIACVGAGSQSIYSV